MVWRRIFHGILHFERFARSLRQRVLFVGWTNEAARVLSAMESDFSQPYEAVGCVMSEEGPCECEVPKSLALLGGYENVTGIVARREVDIVVLAEPSMSPGSIMKLADLCEREYVRFKQIPSYYQILSSSLHLDSISGVPILGTTDLPLNRAVNRTLKRIVDIAGACVGLVFSAPVIALFGLLVYRESPGPIFYRQRRTGRNGREFDIIKIRSMRLDAEAAGAQWAKKDDPRRLKIGAVMRRWNIDETPQFWNVLKGEMSLVGPRPERPELIENFKREIPHYNARHTSKPGMTGWAQVHGLRGNTSLEERVKYDLYYLENWSPRLDLEIMVLTFFRRENAG
jgi:exopolysaccharide biosynthesis polyprenyl glycosylphosphotransferase